MNTSSRASCFDASALLKLYVNEDGSEKLRCYWKGEATKFTTSLCFYKTLTLLKVCHFYRGALDAEGYKSAALDLCSWYGTISNIILEPTFLSPDVFVAAQQTTQRHDIDLSDAFQIHTAKIGFYPILVGTSKKPWVTNGYRALGRHERPVLRRFMNDWSWPH